MPGISDVKSAVVATGIALGGKTQMGNKGAVGISFALLGYSYLFLSCHFAAGQVRQASMSVVEIDVSVDDDVDAHA